MSAANERDPRVQRMMDDPTSYFAEARREAQREAQNAARKEAELRRRKRKHGFRLVSA